MHKQHRRAWQTLALLLLAVDLTYARSRSRTKRGGGGGGDGDGAEAKGACKSEWFRLQPRDRCEQPATAGQFFNAVAGNAGGYSRPACGTLVLVTTEKACGAAGGAPDQERCRSLHKSFADTRKRSSSAVTFVVLDAAQWGEVAAEHGVRQPGGTPSLWWFGSAGYLASWHKRSESVEELAAMLFLHGHELADAFGMMKESLLQFFHNICAATGNFESPLNQGPMIKAIKDGKQDKLQRLIAGGMAVEPRAADGVSPCRSNGWDALCYRPLFEAFQNAAGPADLQLLRPLLAAGADIHALGEDGETVLHAMLHDWADSYYERAIVAEGNPKNRFAQWLVENSPVDIGAVDVYGQTALHIVTAKHNIYMLRWLLELPKAAEVLDIDAVDLSLNTPLHYAAGGDHWFPALSKALMFTPAKAAKHYINFNNPPKYNGWDNTCLSDFDDVSKANNGNASSVNTVTSILTSPTCRYFAVTVELLLEKGSKAVNAANCGGNTPLHVAANSNDVETTQMLLKAGADCTKRNKDGLTPGQLASVMGNYEALAVMPPMSAVEQQELSGHQTAQILRPAESQEATPTATESCASDEDSTNADDGGWSLPTVEDVKAGGGPPLGGDQPCGIEVRHADNFTQSEFEQYVALRRPVKIIGRSLSTTAAAHNRWRREEFVRRYGHLPVTVGTIPYANSFGRGGDSTMTIRKYVEYMETQGASDRYPLYVFNRSPETLRLLPDAGLWDLSFVNSSVLAQHSFQFYLGGPKTGAPNHYHSHAINVLLYGAKRWFLTPPRNADYSSLAPVEFLEQEVPHRQHSMVQCVQRTGEIMYVPADWGHAIVNVRPSIGFAGEFRMVNSIPQPPRVDGGGAVRGHQIGRDAQMEAMLKSEGASSRGKTWDKYLGFHASL